MGQLLSELIYKHYYVKPPYPLYHYTSLKGLKGIIENSELWATDARYLNDAEELSHLAGRVMRHIDRISLNKHGMELDILLQFHNWIRDRLTRGHSMFVASFTKNGNILSQWRGYCEFGQGVSIGFSPEKIEAIRRASDLTLGPCVYTEKDQQDIVIGIVNGVTSEAINRGPGPSGRYSPDQSYYGVFESLEPDILKLGILVKNPSFAEEGEWRLILPIVRDYIKAEIDYREGANALIPYMKIPIRLGLDEEDLSNVTVGPAPDVELSLTSIARFLAKHVRKVSVSASQNSYRG